MLEFVNQLEVTEPGLARASADHRSGSRQQLGEALNAELARAVGSFQYRLTLSCCVNRRLDEIDTWLKTSRAGDPLKAGHPIGGPNFWVILTGAWDVSKSGQTAAHMPLGDRLLCAHIYGAHIAETRRRELDIWRGLGEFNQPEPPDHADRMRMRGAIEAARGTENIMRTSIRFVMPDAEALGVTPERRFAPRADEARAFCGSLFAPPNVGNL